MDGTKTVRADEFDGAADRSGVIAEALWRPMGVDGVYARTSLYEDIVERLGRFISRYRDPNVEVLRFPPVMSRRLLEKAGYLKSFPNLLGCVCGLHGSATEIRQAVQRFEANRDWTDALSPGDLVLTPAACYPVYPLAAMRGVVPRGGHLFDVACDCFRSEPSREVDRFQSFRMREYVCIGAADEVVEFRTRWMQTGEEIADQLGLASRIAPASDPFFGREGQIRAVSQIQMELKFELLVPIRSIESPTACMSFNYHREHFGTTWDIRLEGGGVAHTGCAAFGMDRLAVALFHTHGLDTTAWPSHVRDALSFEPLAP